MKGKILENMEIIRRSQSELSSQSLQSSVRTKTSVHNFDKKKSMSQKKSRAHRKLSNALANCRVEPMDETEISNTKSKYCVPEQVPQPRTSVIWLQRLYELWEPQLCDSYRPSVQSPTPRDDEDGECIITSRDNKRELNSKKKHPNKKNSLESRIGKLKTIETVVETVRHLQKIKAKSPKPNLGRIASVGVIEPSAHRRNSNALKRSLSQHATI